MVLAKITIWSEIWGSGSLVHMIKWRENDFLKFTFTPSYLGVQAGNNFKSGGQTGH